MANKIQLRRDTTSNWERVNPILDDGEPGLNITTNQVKYGDGSTVWNDLPYASGGGFTNVDGVVTFPGDLLIGTLWPNDPMPGGDKESVVWAKDDTEYLGLWWGGSQTYPNISYGPVAGIMIGTGDFNSTDDFSDPSPADTNITIGINNSSGDTNTWIFDRDGILTFPDSTTQSTAYNRTTGSWTVATGSGTYSFTVPENGTYVMWVRGNTDNGIIVWNATATVTNNNVPVIGSQRAWNYTDAGSPILITSIPSQILDEQSTISTTMPIGIGTTSNVFNFGITNSSGSAKTVYWGYVTQ